ncbi:MAG: M16 family metallopeptidase [Acidobacteriota bacterium]
MMALGLRVWLAYGVLGLSSALLCASVPATADTHRTSARQATQQVRQWPTERPPRPLPSRAVKFPPYEIRTLANGLQVVLVSHHEQPAVSVRMLIRAGAAQDPKGKMGLAMLTAALLDQGAGDRTAEQIADSIDFIGGILGTGAGTDLTFVNAIVMKDSLPLALRLLSDVVRRPTLAPQELERQRQQALSGLRVAAEDPNTVANQVIDRLVYGFHPYGLPGNGTPESIGSLTRDDIADFHRRYYVPNNALLAIVGDVSADEALDQLRKTFDDWARRDVPPFTPIEPPPPTRRVVVIDKPDAVQTEIRVGQIGIPRRHDDFMALDQAIKILGGEGANRLQQVLRSQRGLTYGASADLDSYKTAGGVVAETDTRTDATAEVLRLTIDEFQKLQRERVYEGELEGAQAYLAGHFPLTIETPDAIATQVLNQLFYGLPLDELETFPERVRSVSPDDVQRVARSYLRPDRLAVVLVGNANGFVNDLKGVGFGEFERIPIDQVDLLAADLRRGGSPVGEAGARSPRPGARPPFDVASTGRLLLETPSYQRTSSGGPSRATPGQASVDAIIGRAIDAHGGLEALTSVKRLTADATTTIMTPEGPVKASTHTAIEYPDRVRVEARLPDAEILQIYADGKGWLKDPAGIREAPPEMLKDFHASVLRDPIALLRAAATGLVELTLKPEEGHQGQVLKVLTASGRQLAPVSMFFDAHGTLVKLAYQAARGTGEPTVEEWFDDYRRVDGVRVPFKSSLRRQGRVMMERVLVEVIINPRFAPDTFARPTR